MQNVLVRVFLVLLRVFSGLEDGRDVGVMMMYADGIQGDGSGRGSRMVSWMADRSDMNH